MADTNGIVLGEQVNQSTLMTGNTTWLVTAITPTTVTLSSSSGIAASAPEGAAFLFAEPWLSWPVAVASQNVNSVSCPAASGVTVSG